MCLELAVLQKHLTGDYRQILRGMALSYVYEGDLGVLLE